MNQLSELVGGSLVPLEIAEYLRAQGHECLIGVNHLANPLQRMATDQGIKVTDDLTTVNAFEFDLVWIQNHTAPLLRYEMTEAARPRTCFAFAHLSTAAHGGSSLLESPGILFEPLLADRVFANSDEVRAHLLDLGMLPDDVAIFPNPAPPAFWKGRGAVKPGALKRVRLISNHVPAEAVAALEQLAKAGLQVRSVGRRGDEYRRVTPDMMSRPDIVITIGKTAQYALATGIPPYVYDRFGGPGYLDADNFEKAAEFNFSGRCCRRTLDPEAIAKELVDGYPAALKFVSELPEQVLSRYRLEPYIESLLKAIDTAKPNAERLAEMESRAPMLQRERLMAMAIRHNLRGHIERNAKVKRMGVALQRLKADIP